MNYDIIIGLEIHAELNTKTKMFCSCLNKSDYLKPNTNVCPICLAHPGTLPVPNKSAIEKTILLSLALKCQINQETKFDRKNYFYPDLPKGYQISQYDKPFGHDGYLEFDEERIEIERIHLEEDTGKIFHDEDGKKTLIDFNRAGTPLLEMVTKPTIKDAMQAKSFCQNIQKVLRYLAISNANMEKGEMRCEANVSLQKKGAWYYKDGKILANKGKKLNHKVEVKNINSFKSLEKAINFEIKRQAELLDNNIEIFAETRGYNEKKNETISQRKKETAADYRYFKEPDIPEFYIKDEEILNIKKLLIELSMEKKKRFIRQYGIKPESADILVSDKLLADFYEKTVSELGAWIKAEGDDYNRQEKKLAQTAANWINGELLKHLKADKKSAKDIIITAENMAELISLVWQEKINSNTAQEIFQIMYKNGGDPSDIMDDLGLEQIDSSSELEKVIIRIIEENKKQVNEYQAGKLALISYFMGQVMAATKGKANPKIVKQVLEEKLKMDQ